MCAVHWAPPAPQNAATVKAAFGKKSLYEILEVERTASAAAIKKAYFKKALLFVRSCVCFCGWQHACLSRAGVACGDDLSRC